MHQFTKQIGALCLSFALVAAAMIPAAPVGAADDVAKMLESAKTAADHEALAAYYDKQAQEAKEKAALHKRMGEIALKQGGAGVTKWHMDEHCAHLVEQYDNAAKAYSDLAKAHREMAQGMK